MKKRIKINTNNNELTVINNNNWSTSWSITAITLFTIVNNNNNNVIHYSE